MKPTFLCLLLALAAAAPAHAAPPGTTEITVTGRGAIALAPNVAIVSAGVQSNAPTAAQALAENNAAYDRIVGALTGLAITRADISMAGYNVSYTAPRPGQADTEQTGYTVSRDFSVKVRAIAKAGEVTDACIGAGATSINGVQFTLADNAAARAQAVALAVADARKSAELLARESGPARGRHREGLAGQRRRLGAEPGDVPRRGAPDRIRSGQRRGLRLGHRRSFSPSPDRGNETPARAP